jgi:hypothetical protein
VLVAEGSATPDGLPAGAFVLEAPAQDGDDAFATLVGAYAAGLAAGESPAAAFDAAQASWERPVA